MDLSWAGRGDSKTATGTCVPRAHRDLAFNAAPSVCGGKGGMLWAVLWQPWPQGPVKGPESCLFVNSFVYSFVHCSLSLWKVQGR